MPPPPSESTALERGLAAVPARAPEQPVGRLRRAWALGVLLLLAGGPALWFSIATLLRPAHDALLAALGGGLVAAAATAIGTLPALFSRRLSDRTSDAMMGFGAGVMLAACAFSLIVPSLDAADRLGIRPWPAAWLVGGGIVLGAALLLALERWVPHEHFFKGPEGSQIHATHLKRIWLFVFAITLHNVPEGLAIGVAYAGSDPLGAGALATGIAIQDVPEGLVIALALAGAGFRRRIAIGLGAASGLVEPLGAVAGAAVVGTSAVLLPWGLAAAAGAMLFVISHEIIPESHRRGHENFATTGLIGGFVLMMMLDTALG